LPHGLRRLPELFRTLLIRLAVERERQKAGNAQPAQQSPRQASSGIFHRPRTKTEVYTGSRYFANYRQTKTSCADTAQEVSRIVS